MIQISSKADCCGCSACSNICGHQAITMKSDSEDFLYPSVNMKLCTNCGLCEKVCPIINKKEEQQFHQKAYLVQHKDPKILRESTSGGAFTAIAAYILKKGGVVFGAAFDEQFRVVHTSVEDEKELYKFRNSKYVQSDLGDTFRQVRSILKTGRLVCYSGTPCQIEGLKSFLMKDYDNLYMVDVVCRAVPSPMIWEKYKCFVSEGSQIKSAYFRDKRQYGYDYSQLSVKTNLKNYHHGVESDPYLRAFFSGLSVRPSCYACAFKKRYRVSDLTIWDCFDPSKMDKSLDNNGGVTRILVQSEKGALLTSEILDSFQYKEVPPERVLAGVREMFHAASMNPRRKEFFEDARSMEEEAFFKKYFPDSMKVKAERLIRHSSEKLGIYRFVKRTAKKILGK